MSAPLAFLDIESDGVHPDRKAWEIAIVRREPGGAETAWQAFVEIDLSDTPDGFGLSVGRYHDRHPFGRFISLGDDSALGSALIPEHAAIEVARRTHGAVVVGINPSFDTHTLDRLLRANGLIPAWGYMPICAKTLAVGYLRGWGNKEISPPYRTDDLTEALGLEPAPEDERHTAMGDVRFAMRIYDAVMGGTS